MPPPPPTPITLMVHGEQPGATVCRLTCARVGHDEAWVGTVRLGTAGGRRPADSTPRAVVEEGAGAEEQVMMQVEMEVKEVGVEEVGVEESEVVKEEAETAPRT